VIDVEMAARTTTDNRPAENGSGAIHYDPASVRQTDVVDYLRATSRPHGPSPLGEAIL
jgi:hypothetical protein